MSDPINQTIVGGNPAKQDASIDLRPTLFIGVGGTGMEVLMRVRRRILNNLWGSGLNRNRVDSLADFPVAQFIQFDLDSGAVIDSGRAQAEDLQYDLVKFSDEDKIVESFDIENYSRDDDALEKYPHIKEWQPLTPKKIRELGIDPSKGAGQIRSLARLYLYDKYPKLRGRIKGALKKGGYATFQTGVPFYQPWEITEALEELSRFFPRSGLYLSVVPTYIGGFMALSWASKGGKPLGTAAGIAKAKAAYKRIKLKCDYYNPEIHAAAFALPNWIKKLVP